MAGTWTTHRAPPDHDVVVVGAGFAGLYELRRLREEGVSMLLLEAGSGLGGIWHWNCYPGARVDSHVPLYEYSDGAVWRDWYWEERFPDWRALRRYFDHVDSRWDLRRDIRVDTRLRGAEWEESGRTWRLATDAGDALRTRFLILCTGFAAKAYVPALPGLRDFTRAWHHTAQWPQEGIDLTGLRVGVIGKECAPTSVWPATAFPTSCTCTDRRVPRGSAMVRRAQRYRATGWWN
jgi:cation diffusion facilitator CzcD-associated flavoprotein CzcO